MSAASTSTALYAAVVSPAQFAGAEPEDAKELRHHLKGGKGFHNPWASFQDRSPFYFFRTMGLRFLRGEVKRPDTSPSNIPKVRKPDFLPTRETPNLRATWLGHACFYVEFPSGLRVLFDPVFTDRCSPFSFIGPKRYTPPPCRIEDLPIIDLVIISHNHYDHLSHPTIEKIKTLHPNVHFFAPLGNKRWFEGCGIHNATELDWWQDRSVKLSAIGSKEKAEQKQRTTSSSSEVSELQVGGSPDITASISCLPCQHMAARGPFDRNTTLWASWSVESGGKKLWFGGDTGYRTVPPTSPGTDDYGANFSSLPHCPAFSQIGQHRGPFDLGLIPIGAYDPRFVMSPVHANPFDSVNMFVDTRCKRALGMHWGTWVLTEEDVLEPPAMLRQALRKKGIPESGVFDVCEIGESTTVEGKEGELSPKL